MQQVDSPQTTGMRFQQLRRATNAGAQCAQLVPKVAEILSTSIFRMFGIL